MDMTLQKIKRLTAFILFAVIMLSLFACSGDVSDSGKESGLPASDESTKPAVTEPAIEYEPDDLPELNFSGESIEFYVGDSHLDEITVEELRSEAVNDSIYNRELFVEERLGVDISVVYGNSQNALLKQVTADEDTFDIYCDCIHYLSPYIFDGYLVDARELDYLDLSKPWWPDDFIQAVELEDRLFLLSGPLSLSRTKYTFAVYFNKDLADDYAETIPELSDLYTLVEEGKWTFDVMTSITDSVYQDLNGNSDRDEDDIYGIGIQTDIGLDPVWSGFEISILEHTDDGWFSVNSNTEKMFAGLEKFRSMMFDSNGTYLTRSREDSSLFDELAVRFANGQLLFMLNKFEAAEKETLRNMKSDYGIIPFPKYDEKQKEYGSHSHDNQMAFAIPITNENADMAAAVLEAMASYSYRDTHPTYLDFALKGKYMSDARARKMVDLINAHVSFDPYWAYVSTLGGGFVFSFRSALRSNNSAFASEYASAAASVKRNLIGYKVKYNAQFKDD